MKRLAEVEGVDTVHHQAPIHVAAMEGHWDVADFLLSQGAIANQPDGRGRTPLMLAAAGGHAGVVDLLVHHGAGLEESDKEGITPLTHAIISGHCKIAQCLLNRGANVNTMEQRCCGDGLPQEGSKAWTCYMGDGRG